MNSDEVMRKIGDIGILPVVRAASLSDASRAVEAICAGGITAVEITMTVPDAIRLIEQLAHTLGTSILIGAGTVLNAEQAKRCLDAGAEFLVSPGLSIPVLAVAQACDKLAIPGALTPTELMQALAHQAKLVKIFPCSSAGGAKHLKALKGPFPDVAMIPTGGVSAANVAEFIAAGAFAVGIGGELVDASALRSGSVAAITAAAERLVGAIASARGSQS